MISGTALTEALTAALLAGLLLLAPALVVAQDSGDSVSYKQRTVIDLTGAVIEGELTKPEGSYIVNRKVSRFSSLITLRENFVPELLASPDQL